MKSTRTFELKMEFSVTVIIKHNYSVSSSSISNFHNKPPTTQKIKTLLYKNSVREFLQYSSNQHSLTKSHF